MGERRAVRMAVQPTVRIAVAVGSTDDPVLRSQPTMWSVVAVACGVAVLNLEGRQPIELWRGDRAITAALRLTLALL